MRKRNLLEEQEQDGGDPIGPPDHFANDGPHGVPYFFITAPTPTFVWMPDGRMSLPAGILKPALTNLSPKPQAPHLVAEPVQAVQLAAMPQAAPPPSLTQAQVDAFEAG